MYTNRYYNIRSYTSIALVSEPFDFSGLHRAQRMPGEKRLRSSLDVISFNSSINACQEGAEASH